MECYRLNNLMQLVKIWSLKLMGLFNISLFIYGVVKLAIWCTRKNKVEEIGCIDPILLTKCFVKKANGRVCFL